jgi:hypothetical protein
MSEQRAANAARPSATPAPAVAIERLSLRLPGPAATRASSAALGRRVAARAAALLAERLPAGAAGHVGRIRLRVPVRAAGGAETGEAEMSEAVATALARALGRSG